MRYGNYILSASFALIALIVLISLAPEKVAAQSEQPVPISDKALRDKEAGLTIFGVTIPGLTWDSIVIALSKIAIEEILDETTEWVNSGFEGNPAYATDPEQFFTDIADNIAGEFILGSDLAFLCSPFQVKVRLALQQYRTQRRVFQCSLTEVVGNIEAFYTDFSQGGWDGWFSMTQNDTNNPYGAYLTAQVELDSRIASAIGIQDKQLSWNSGFLSWSECIAEHPDTGQCLKRGPTKTPGKVIEDQLNNNLGSGIRQLELADEFDELISALAVQLIKQVLSGARGLFTDSVDSPPEPPVALGISKLGTGSGVVTSSPGGINCGSTCFASFGHGASVTLTATPSANSIFTGWPGACFGTGTCVATMNADKFVTAMFDLGSTLSIAKSGTGSGTVTSNPAGINCGLTCQALYPADASVIITAAASPDSVFVGWSGGGCPTTGTSRTCTVNLSTDKSVTATFNLRTTLTVSKAGTGSGTVTSNPAGINCGPSCSAGYPNGTSVTLSATPSFDSTFTGWSGVCFGTESCVVSMTAARSVTATFTYLFTQ